MRVQHELCVDVTDRYQRHAESTSAQEIEVYGLVVCVCHSLSTYTSIVLCNTGLSSQSPVSLSHTQTLSNYPSLCLSLSHTHVSPFPSLTPYPLIYIQFIYKCYVLFALYFPSLFKKRVIKIASPIHFTLSIYPYIEFISGEKAAKRVVRLLRRVNA